MNLIQWILENLTISAIVAGLAFFATATGGYAALKYDVERLKE